MPFMKVNLNGRKYVISGLTERTSSTNNILYSLARADSTLNLQTSCTEYSDTSTEYEDRNKGTRIKRTRRTKVRRSSTSSVEVVQVKHKDMVKSALTDKNLLIDLESSELSEGQRNAYEIPNIDKSSHVICTECHATHSKDSKCSNCKTKKAPIESIELKEICHAKKTDDVTRRKRKSRKRPVSQDVTEKTGENKEGKETELGEKGWKSADDVKEPIDSSSENPNEKRDKKHKRKHKHRCSSKIDKESRKLSQKAISIKQVDNTSECYRINRNVGDLRIQKMITRTIDERFVNFHVACMKSYASTPQSSQANEEEIREKLLQLVESQHKCLSALKKAEKQNKRSLSRYTRYLNLDKESLQLPLVKTKSNPERARKSSDTDTGISEMYSDTSSSHDFESNDVIIDDLPRDNVSATSSFNHFDVTYDDKLDNHTDSGVSSNHDVSIENDVNSQQEPTQPNYVVTVDAIAVDDATHDVKTYVYVKDDDTRSEIIVAAPTGVDAPHERKSLVPYRSVDSINTSTLSDNSDLGNHGDCDDVNELKRVLMQEQEKQREKRRQLEHHQQEMNLMDTRIDEQEKMAEILLQLKDLNKGLVEQETKENPNKNEEYTSLEKSIELSMNLYKYQKGEISKNALSMEHIESQVRRKRWHVESAVRELERIVSSPSHSKLDRIRSLERLPSAFAGMTMNGDVTLNTLV